MLSTAQRRFGLKHRVTILLSSFAAYFLMACGSSGDRDALCQRGFTGLKPMISPTLDVRDAVARAETVEQAREQFDSIFKEARKIDELAPDDLDESTGEVLELYAELAEELNTATVEELEGLALDFRDDFTRLEIDGKIRPFLAFLDDCGLGPDDPAPSP